MKGKSTKGHFGISVGSLIYKNINILNQAYLYDISIELYMVAKI